MKKIMFFFSILFLSFCQQKDKKVISQTDSQCLDIRKLNQERLEIDSIIVSGDIPLKTTTKNLLILLGKPDTIISVYPNFSNGPRDDFDSKALYFKDLRYVTLYENAYIQSINFDSSNIRVMHPKITLDGNTTIMDVQRKFPQAGRLIHGGGQTFNGFMELRTSRNWGDIAVWFLVFKRSKLIRMDLIDPS